MDQPTSRHKIKISLFIWKYFTWLNILFFITLLFLGYTYIIKPKYNAIGTETSQALEKLKAEYERRDAYLSHLIQLNRQFQKISDQDKQKVDKILASEPDMENLLKQIELIVKRNGFLIQSLSITTEKEKQDQEASKSKNKTLKKTKKSPVGKMKIELSLAGVNYQSLKRLLGIFEQNIRLMDVNNIDFEPSAQTVNLTIYTYYENWQKSDTARPKVE